MPIPTNEIINLLSTIANEEQIKVTVTQCVRAGLIAGSIAFVGGCVAGLPGIAAGGTIGGCIAAATSKKFLTVPQILANMEHEKRKHLAENVRTIMRNINITDVAVFASMLAGNTSLRSEVVDALCNFLRNEMQMAIVDH